MNSQTNNSEETYLDEDYSSELEFVCGQLHVENSFQMMSNDIMRMSSREYCNSKRDKTFLSSYSSISHILKILQDYIIYHNMSMNLTKI